MRYNVQRALVFDGKVFNLNDYVLINEVIATRLIDITFVDEYNAKIITPEGEYLLDEIERLEKLVLFGF